MDGWTGRQTGNGAGHHGGPGAGPGHGPPHAAGHGDVGEELRLLGLALLDRVEPRARSVLAGLRVEAAAAAQATAATGMTGATQAAGATETAGATEATGATQAAGATEAAGAAGAAATAGTTGGRASEQRPAACEWCPVCSAIALFRGEAPELGGRIAEQGDALLTVLRSLLERPAAGGC